MAPLQLVKILNWAILFSALTNDPSRCLLSPAETLDLDVTCSADERGFEVQTLEKPFSVSFLGCYR